MGRMQAYLDLVAKSRLLAPNLKEMTLRVFTGNAHTGNAVARKVVKDHLLALRWMNPNAVVYLREAKGQGTPAVEYTLWTEGGATTHSFEVKGSLTPEDVVAKVMMASRDPALGDAPDAAAAPAAGAATGAAAAAAAAAASGGPAPAAPARPAVVSPLTSAPYTGADYPGRLA